MSGQSAVAARVAPVAGRGTTPPAFLPVGRPVLQRRCACGGTRGPDGECAACHVRRLARQCHAPLQAAPAAAPPIVHEVLRSPGRPLDPATRAYLEPRFGHDFGRVRVHADAKAAAARAVDALAYTVGPDVVFAAGRYQPHTSAGRRLLAHELTHVVQQGTAGARPGQALMVGEADGPGEAEAERIATRIAGARIAEPEAVVDRAGEADEGCRARL